MCSKHLAESEIMDRKKKSSNKQSINALINHFDSNCRFVWSNLIVFIDPIQICKT